MWCAKEAKLYNRAKRRQIPKIVPSGLFFSVKILINWLNKVLIISITIDII